MKCDDCKTHEKGQINSDEKEKIVLVGNPNVGKSVIFGLLTGKYVTVSNYPGTTVEITQGIFQKNNKILVIDTPGTNTLNPQSEDERVTRDVILNENLKTIIQVADTKNISRSLFLSIQLAEIGIPFILDLNMEDEAKSRGITIDNMKLSKILDIEVIPTVAVERKGINNLIKSICNNARISNLNVNYDNEIELAVQKISNFLPDTSVSHKFLALSILSGDETIKNLLFPGEKNENIWKKIEQIKSSCQSHYVKPLNQIINQKRLNKSEEILKEIYHKENNNKQEKLKNFLNIFGEFSTHPLAGIPILLGILYLTYQFVGVLGAGTLVGILENKLFGEYINPWVTQLTTKFIPFELLRQFLVGEYGLITMALTYGLAIILPVVGTFFIAFGILEDSGYLPRLAVMVNRIFKFIGLNGKAVLPMILGFGCGTMAVMTTRILESKKERLLATFLLALAIPCSAQLGVIMGLLGSLSIVAFLWWIFPVISVFILIGYLTAKILPGESTEFMLEIPPVRIPKISNILVKTFGRVKWYAKEVIPIFIAATAFLFIIDKIGVLHFIENIASPIIVGFLGLPIKATETFLMGFLRRDFGAAGLYALAQQGLMNHQQTVISLVTITLFVPCFANFIMIAKERGVKSALYMVSFIIPFAIAIGGILNFIFHIFHIRF